MTRILATKTSKRLLPEGTGTPLFRPWRARLLWEPRDLWIGLYWDAHTNDYPRWRPWRSPLYDVYVCLIPCLVLHVRRIK